MNYNIANLFSDHLATALSSTLIHSLWQGALLSALTGLLMVGTRKSPPARRYNLLVAAMALFAVVVAGTFIFEINKGAGRMPAAAGQYVVNAGAALPSPTINPGASPAPIRQTIGSFLNNYSSAIVWVWLLIVCARCVRLTTGLRDVYHLRHKDISGLSAYWEERVWQLCAQMGIKRWVGAVESARAKMPMVIGYLKPMVLLPLGMLASLSAEEAEAILLHELAHIRRADYLVNLLQNIMEIAFFFNPAVLWLSALIKAERENCCDDIAVARSGKINYLKALVACHEYNQPGPAYAMALKGRSGSLTNRVARIISNKNLSLNGKEKSLLAVCLVAAGIFTAVITNGQQLTRLAKAAGSTATDMLAPSATDNKTAGASSSKKDKAPALAALVDTAVGKPAEADTAKHFKGNKNASSHADRTASIISDMLKDGIITTENGLSFKIGKDEFVVNYKKQPEAVYQKYRAKYVDDPDHGGDWAWYYHFENEAYPATVAGKPRPAENAPKAADAPIAGRAKPAALALSEAYPATVAGKPLPAENARKAADAPTAEGAEPATLALSASSAPVAPQATAATLASAAQPYNLQAATPDEKWTQDMISDLLKDGIITGTDDLSFKIGTDEFVVNYQKQPEAVYQKYRAKYVVPRHRGRGDWIWFYRFETKKWEDMTSHKHNSAKSNNSQMDDEKTGIFQGKSN